jgi:hypothetical protein
VPLACLPLPVAKTAHFAVTVALIVVTAPALERFLSDIFFEGRRARTRTILFLSTLVVIVLYERELGLGNHNVVLLAMLVWSLRLMLTRREYSASILIALAVLFKPHFLVLTPLMVLRGRLRTLVAMAGTMCGGVLLPTVVLGVTKSVELHADWIRTMIAHNAGVGTDVNTFQGLLYRAGVSHLEREVGAAYALGVISAAA